MDAKVEDPVSERGANDYGDGISWIRGSILGKGSFGRVYKATNRRPKFSCFPREMAVKSADASCSSTLQKEKEVLTSLSASPYVIHCYGDETTTGDRGSIAYNLLLVYASGGTLADRIARSGGGGLPELEVKTHTRSILRGLSHVHETGYAHCDLKPENILLMPRGTNHAEFTAKIGDFGLAKRSKQQSRKRKLVGPDHWRGTAMYLSPEVVDDGLQESPADVWAVGCITLEMLTGKPPWEGGKEEILRKLGVEREIPEIPDGISREAKDFLKRCLVRNPMFRFTCVMLLNHAFIEGLAGDFDAEVEEFDESVESSVCSSSTEEEGESEEEAGRDSDRSEEVVSRKIHLRRVYPRRHCPLVSLSMQRSKRSEAAKNIDDFPKL